jgi:hypothetical protein
MTSPIKEVGELSPSRNGGETGAATPKSAAPWIATLSDDAKCVIGGHFGMMITPGKGDVTFQTPWNRTPRAIAAFDEAVAAGVLSVVDGEKGRWARTYRALVDCRPAYDWFGRNLSKGKFSVMVPDAERKERPPRGWTPIAKADDQA